MNVSLGRRKYTLRKRVGGFKRGKGRQAAASGAKSLIEVVNLDYRGITFRCLPRAERVHIHSSFTLDPTGAPEATVCNVSFKLEVLSACQTKFFGR